MKRHVRYGALDALLNPLSYRVLNEVVLCARNLGKGYVIEYSVPVQYRRRTMVVRVRFCDESGGFFFLLLLLFFPIKEGITLNYRLQSN